MPTPEPEITPAMILAGVVKLESYLSDERIYDTAPEEIVSQVYRAMEAVREDGK